MVDPNASLLRAEAEEFVSTSTAQQGPSWQTDDQNRNFYIDNEGNHIYHLQDTNGIWDYWFNQDNQWYYQFNNK